MLKEHNRYSRLAELTKIINMKLDLPEVLKHVTAAISEEIVQCDAVGIFLPDEKGTFQSVAGKPEFINGNSISSQKIDFDTDQLARDVMITKQTIYIPDTSKDSRPNPQAVAAFNIQSLLGIPIIYEEHLFGLVFLFDCGKQMNITDIQIQSVEAYVNMAAVAIQNANNLKQKEHLIAEKQLLLDANRDLSRCSSIQESLDTCFYYLEKTVDCKNVAVYMEDPNNPDTVKFKEMSKESEWTVQDWKSAIDDIQINRSTENVIHEVMGTRSIKFIPSEERCRLLLIPLISKGETFGVVAIACLMETLQSDEKSQVHLAQSIVDATALTYSNLTYRDQLEMRVKTRTNELANANGKVVSVMESITDGFFALNKDWEFIYINRHQPLPEGKTAMNMLGEKIWSIIPENLIGVLEKELHRPMYDRLPVHFEFSSPADSYWYDVVAYPFDDGICCLSKNTTEKKKYELELKRLSNLELIGQMAAGISHEIRNPMTTVRGFLQFLTDDTDLTKYNNYFELMIDELDRANSIISEFLSMGNTRSSELTMQDLNAIICDIWPLLEIDTFNQNKFIEFETQNIPPMLLNRDEIRQLLINLCRNGLEAMEPSKMLSIRTYTEDKNTVVLEIRDQGQGMDKEVLKKIGTPFYTTKDNGTGLGLGVSYAIAARHNAKIEVQSSSKGTVFYVKFSLEAKGSN
ncbi:GAF domain-containing protein [Planococcus sp. CPCC 101016]|uniref:GAF domain-containing sensor histidine kinase n=1 Tax=Planococcus sp. CPCC 101016 TaxID=2599617 RepID=UPI0011B4DE97|nr:GAF domain-containing sensor histidine kinase [Planococcus sp. CPCC 101016]TWT08105.1 GAF domain-containing protein [Planococcus sp. CPCC 101016]